MTDRYARQRALAGVGDDGQRRLGEATVLVVGLGALGCPAAAYLAGAGVGRLVLVDFDRVALDNLHRQTLYRESDVGRSKAEVAADALRERNGDVALVAHARPFEPGDLDGVGVVLDCTDDPGTRDHLHALCVERGVPLCWGAVEGWDGQAATVLPGGPCLRCLWPSPGNTPSCADVGVLGPVAGMVGLQQALSALRVLLGDADRGAGGGRLWLLDGRSGDVDTVAFQRRPGCPTCNTATK